MLDRDDILPDELAHPTLQQDLQTFHQWNAEEKQAYQRVRERLLQKSLPVPVPEPLLPFSAEKQEFQHTFAPPVRKKRPQRWIQRLMVAMVTLVVLALVGAFSLRAHTVTSSPSEIGRTPIVLGYSRLAMITEQIGWLVGDRPNNPRSTVLRTTDGGKTWSNVTPPGVTKSLGDVYVLDEEMAWVPLYEHSILPNAVALTIDGGKSWQHFACPQNQPCNVDYVDQAHAWAVVQGSPQPDKVLYSTSDGGKTWKRVADLPSPYASVQFLNTQTGWLQTIDISESAGGAIWQLFITHDGGKSWKKLTLPEPEEVQSSAWPGYMSPPTFVNQHNGYLFVGKALNDDEHVYVTRDGGNSWQIDGEALPANTYVRQFIDNEHIIGSRNNVNNSLSLFTLTGGKWVVTDYQFTNVHLLDDVSFVSLKVGTILDANGSALNVLQTTDAGNTWHSLSTVRPLA